VKATDVYEYLEFHCAIERLITSFQLLSMTFYMSQEYTDLIYIKKELDPHLTYILYAFNA